MKLVKIQLAWSRCVWAPHIAGRGLWLIHRFMSVLTIMPHYVGMKELIKQAK